MLVIIGDEDESTHGLAVHLKKHVPRCGVLEMPKIGHTMNLEEPAAFNAAVQDFLHAVENDRWPARGRGQTATRSFRRASTRPERNRGIFAGSATLRGALPAKSATSSPAGSSA